VEVEVEVEVERLSFCSTLVSTVSTVLIEWERSKPSPIGQETTEPVGIKSTQQELQKWWEEEQEQRVVLLLNWEHLSHSINGEEEEEEEEEEVLVGNIEDIIRKIYL
jgi:hypothetical protein